MSDMQPMGTQRTVLTDINIPFWRMVSILIKWFLASIPAIIIIWIIFALIGLIVAAILGQSFMDMWHFGRPPFSGAG